MYYTDEMVKNHKLDKVCSLCGEPAHAFLPFKGKRKALEICHRCAITVLPGLIGETVVADEKFAEHMDNPEGYLETNKLMTDVYFWKYVACTMPLLIKPPPLQEKPAKRRPGRPRKKKTEEPTKGGGSVVPFTKSQQDSKRIPSSSQKGPQQPKQTPSLPQPGNSSTDNQKTGETKITETVTRRRSTAKNQSDTA